MPETDYARRAADLGRRARTAARALRAAGGTEKTLALGAMAAALRDATDRIVQANAVDLEGARAAGLTPAMIDRLTLTPERIEKMAKGIEEVAALVDPVGATLEGYVRPSGLRIERVRVPLGVILVIYESRPNVTSDVAALALKSGNACVLRGGSEALKTNLAIHAALAGALEQVNLPADAVLIVDDPDRRLLAALLKQDATIDLVIPRGGEGLIRAVAEGSSIPVIKHYKGVCHVYVDDLADLEMADEICFNAKVQRPGVCNAMETMLVHSHVAARFLPRICRRLAEAGVGLRGCEKTREIWPDAEPATEEDWAAEYLNLTLAIRVVNHLADAVDHIARYGSAHTDAIVSEDVRRIARFVRDVDSSSVMVNASTRFSDGGEYGLGAEVGISTDKLHARGPMGCRDLTTYKWIVTGQGHVRE